MATFGTIASAQQLYEHGRLCEMPLADLQPDPDQPRKYIDPAALAELIASIREHRVVAPLERFILNRAADRLIHNYINLLI